MITPLYSFFAGRGRLFWGLLRKKMNCQSAALAPSGVVGGFLLAGGSAGAGDDFFGWSVYGEKLVCALRGETTDGGARFFQSADNAAPDGCAVG